MLSTGRRSPARLRFYVLVARHGSCSGLAADASFPALSGTPVGCGRQLLARNEERTRDDQPSAQQPRRTQVLAQEEPSQHDYKDDAEPIKRTDLGGRSSL